MATNQDSIISQSVLQTDASETTSWRWIATMKPRDQVTEEEKKYIFSCGALTYLWEHGERGYLRSISNKHCWTGCVLCNGNCGIW